MFVLVTPARDEADNVAGLVACVRASGLRPDRWVVVDDGSTDETGVKFRDLGSDLDCLEVVRLEGRAGYMGFHYADVVAAGFAAAADAVSVADVVGILDADIRVGPTYWTALRAALNTDPGLGIVSGALASQGSDGIWRLESGQRIDLPRGGLRLTRGDCFRAIGGVRHARAPDSVMTAGAKSLGWRTALYERVVAYSTRPTDTRGDVSGAESRGRRAWNIHQPAWQVVLRGAGIAASGRVGEGWGLLRGWLAEARSDGDRVDAPGVRDYYRKERPREWARSLRSRVSGIGDPHRFVAPREVPSLDFDECG
jgi:hypothetical protein